jgi:small conductance mechanosensitive channel
MSVSNSCRKYLALLALFFWCCTAVAQQPVAAEGQAVQALKTLPAEVKAGFDVASEGFDRNLEALEDLSKRMESAEGLTREILTIRFDRRWLSTLNEAVTFATQVANSRDQGFAVGPYEARVRDILSRLPAAVVAASQRVASRVVLPDLSQLPAEQAAADQRFFHAMKLVHDVDKGLISAINVAKRYAIDVSKDEAYVRSCIIDATTNTSVFLDIAINDLDGLQVSLSLMKDDKDLQAKVLVAGIRVKSIAEAIELNLDLMKQLDIPTAEYRQQLLTATGKISSSIFDSGVIAGLFDNWVRGFFNKVLVQGPDLFFELLVVALIIFAFVKLAKLVRAGLEHALDRSNARLSRLLKDMILATSKNLVIFLGIMIGLSQLGLSLGPLLTGLGIAGFIVGFALQDSLSNFASGLMILFYRPFDVHDTIEAAGARGRVNDMTLVNTTILTFDNQRLVIPNNKIWQDVIINVTYQTQRRIDMELGVSYDQDIDEVFKVLLDVVKADDRVLEDPLPEVWLGSFGESSINILCRPWVKTADYWHVYWDLNKAIKQAFDANGIQIPFPQRDVHLFDSRRTKADSADNKDV